ncbi:MAG: hypothetical protein OHK0019_08910 [Saprospiraceae bacterium]
MPEIDRIFGIRICVFSRDHLPPHFHAFYGEYEALIAIREGTVIAGGLPRRKLREALEYLANNRQDLLETFYQLNPTLRQ